jgi:hypothetical protein
METGQVFRNFVFGFEHKDDGKISEKRQCSLNTEWSTRIWRFSSVCTAGLDEKPEKKNNQNSEEIQLSSSWKGGGEIRRNVLEICKGSVAVHVRQFQ